jgi:hypothetical protein
MIPLPLHPQDHLDVTRFEREEERRKSALRRLAREARQSRPSTSRHTSLSKVVSAIRALFQPDGRMAAIPEPVEVPWADG